MAHYGRGAGVAEEEEEEEEEEEPVLLLDCATSGKWMTELPDEKVDQDPLREMAPTRTVTNLDVGGSKDKEKARWDTIASRIFCELCADEVQAGNRPSTHLNNVGYKNVQQKFLARTKRNYNRKQLKNRWDALKKNFTLFKSLVGNETGLGWKKGTIDANEDWWARVEAINPGISQKFRNKPFADYELQQIMFEGTVTTGVERCVLGAVDATSVKVVDLSEGSDSSDDNIDAIAGPEQQGKRLMTHFERPPKKLKNKSSSAGLVQAQMKRLAGAVESSAISMTSRALGCGPTISEVMQMVLDAGIVGGGAEYFYCSDIFLDRDMREMFAAILPKFRAAYIRRLVAKRGGSS